MDGEVFLEVGTCLLGCFAASSSRYFDLEDYAVIEVKGLGDLNELIGSAFIRRSEIVLKQGPKS